MGISWQKINNDNCIGRKYIDKSILKYGIHIPIEYRTGFFNNIQDHYIESSKSQQIKLIFEDYTALAEIRNINRNNVKSDTIQIRYDSNKEFKQYLENKFKYTCNLIENNYTDVDTDEYIEFYKGENLNEFIIMYKSIDNIHYIKNENLDEAAIKFIDVIKKQKMSKSYKIPTLLTFYNYGEMKCKVSYDEIGHSLKKYYSVKRHREDIKNDESENLEDIKYFINKAKETSMKYLPQEYFYDDKLNKCYCLSDEISKYVNDKKFIQEYKSSIYLLERKYFNISEKEQFISWMKENTRLSQSSIDKYSAAVSKISQIYKNDKDYLYSTVDINTLREEVEYITLDKNFEDKDITGNRMYSNGLKKLLQYRSDTEEIIPINTEGEISMMDIECVDGVNYINDYIKNQGYTYTKEQLSNLYLSLKTKPFVILAGISGTGKSKIVRLFANALGATTENNQFNLISVRPDWNDGCDLIGYKNLNDEFIEGQLTKTIIEASKPENKDKPYFICLDEMNLARVEYYLSDYLSVIESRQKVGQEIITDKLVQDKDLHIPENIYLIGTVNMDDTTFTFSRKVLDRANTIEFSDVNLENLFGESDNEDLEAININNQFLNTNYLKTIDIEEEYREYAKEINKKIIEINKILKKSKKQFAYRVRDEILFYMIENKKSELLDENLAFDYQIMQKILPAINGSERSIEKILVDLFNFICEKTVIEFADIEEAENYLQNEEVRYKNSAEKIIYMLKGYNDDGYVSYWY